MEVSNYLVSWVVTHLGDLQPTYIGVIIYLLSSMDILVATPKKGGRFVGHDFPRRELQCCAIFPGW